MPPTVTGVGTSEPKPPLRQSRLVFVTSPEPLDVDGVLKAARAVAAGDAPRTASLPLPDGLHQDSLVLDKRGSR